MPKRIVSNLWIPTNGTNWPSKRYFLKRCVIISARWLAQTSSGRMANQSRFRPFLEIFGEIFPALGNFKKEVENSCTVLPEIIQILHAFQAKSGLYSLLTRKAFPYHFPNLVFSIRPLNLIQKPDPGKRSRSNRPIFQIELERQPFAGSVPFPFGSMYLSHDPLVRDRRLSHIGGFLTVFWPAFWAVSPLCKFIRTKKITCKSAKDCYPSGLY